MAFSQYPNSAVKSSAPSISTPWLSKPNRKSLQLDRTAPDVKCTQKTCTADSQNKESLPTESTPDHLGFVKTIPDIIGVDQQEAIKNASYPNKHSMFVESNTLCAQTIQGTIPTSALRKGYVVKNYPAAKINAVTGLYERSPPQRLNSTITRENISSSLMAQLKKYIPHVRLYYDNYTSKGQLGPEKLCLCLSTQKECALIVLKSDNIKTIFVIKLWPIPVVRAIVYEIHFLLRAYMPTHL